MKNIFQNPNSKNSGSARRGAFTLVELLVVISIIAVIAGFTLVAVSSTGRVRKISVAQGELKSIEAALENYHAKYGVYPPGNKNAATATYEPALLNQLYYELVGTTNTGSSFRILTLDDDSTISTSPINLVSKAYGVGGFINCTKGVGEDNMAAAKNFLSSLSSKQFNTFITNEYYAGTKIRTTELITSVGGPDDNYQPLGAPALNPIRYVYPGTNNVGGYDLWVQLVIKGKTNLVCNWSKSVIINSSMP